MTALGTDSGDRVSAGELRHLRILASAGSGKTYQLTNRYLALIQAGADPGTILASTFTRLAAGQIRNRILTRLAEAVDDEEKRRQLAVDIDAPALSRERVLELLARLARNVHRMNVRTLDSFFASVTSAFALELGLPLHPRIVEEGEGAALRAEAMRRMLDERRTQELVDQLRLLTQGAADRSIMRAIDTAVSGLYELSRETEPDAWECITRLPMKTEKQIVGLIEMVEDCELPEDKRFHKARRRDLDMLYDRDWAGLLDGGLAKVVASGNASYYGKDVPKSTIETYESLVEHARAVVVNRYRDQTLATRDLLAWFHAQYDELKRRRRALTFADLTDAMLGAERLGTLADICFRLDASIQHLLLDEFQDTSVKQWNALAPFIQEIVDNAPPDRTFFCVGDVKQSIYGWRDAAPDVLEDMPQLLEGHDETTLGRETLETSWRSSQVVIDTVNRTFLGIGGNPAVGKWPEVQETWSEWFREHETARDLPGHAELRTAPRPPEGSAARPNDMRLEAAAQLVADLHARHPGLRIAMLTRTNDTVAHLLFLLGQHRVPATGRGGGPLTDAPPVNVLLDLLQLADHPDDTVAAFNVGASPLAAHLGVDASMAVAEDATNRHRLAARVRRELLEEGYAAALSGWVRAMAPACDARQLRRLMQLVELGAQFDEEPGLRPGDFIHLVEQTVVPQIEPAPVQVMTVHQSKGLEYDIVVLPELEWPLAGHRTPEVVFERAGTTGPIRRICRYIKNDARRFVPELDPLFAADEYRTVRESLCLLYVAMTRAKQGLHMIIDPPRENERTLPKTAAGVLRCALVGSPDPGRLAADAAVFRAGDDGWIDTAAGTKAVATEPVPAVERIELADPGGSVRYGAAATPASALGHAPKLGEALALRDDEALDRGSAIHALFEEVEWLEDFTATDDELRDALRRIMPRRGDEWIDRRVADFRAMLERDDVRRTLSLGSRDPAAVRIWRELPFARNVDGRLQTGFIDRLEATLDEAGAPVRGVVIDFKTDAVAPGRESDHAERYRAQLEVYGEAAARRTGLAPGSIDLVVAFVTSGVAVSLA